MMRLWWHLGEVRVKVGFMKALSVDVGDGWQEERCQDDRSEFGSGGGVDTAVAPHESVGVAEAH